MVESHGPEKLGRLEPRRPGGWHRHSARPPQRPMVGHRPQGSPWNLHSFERNLRCIASIQLASCICVTAAINSYNSYR